jgi:hypothetical protein
MPFRAAQEPQPFLVEQVGDRFGEPGSGKRDLASFAESVLK